MSRTVLHIRMSPMRWTALFILSCLPLFLIVSANNVFASAGSTAAIGDIVWLDENGDGVQNAGEGGIANVAVALLDSSNSVVMTTTTNYDGGYLFGDLAAGTYTVSVTAPTGLVPTADRDGIGTPSTASLMVSVGMTYDMTDFGYNWTSSADTDSPTASSTGAIGDRLWFDADSDGVQDPGEVGIGGVTVNLLSDPDGNGIYDTVTLSTTTDASGHYIFDDLLMGGYVVQVVTPTLPSNLGDNPTGDPDGDGNSISDVMLLGPGDVMSSADFGFYLDSTKLTESNLISGTVFFDADVDGTQDAGEAGFPSVPVSLYDTTTGLIVATVWSDSNGTFTFPAVFDGSYQIRIDDTFNTLDGLDLTGSGHPLMGSGTNLVVIAADQTGLEFGYAPTGQTAAEGVIGDTIYFDINDSSSRDAGEPGLEGVRVTLTQGGSTWETYTNANGQYFFGNLDASLLYFITIDTATIPSGMVNTEDPDASVSNFASVDLSGYTDGIALDQDFGYTADSDKIGSIGNLVWNDIDADARKDAAESGFEGVTLDLYWDMDGDGVLDEGEPRIGTETTNASGAYLFDRLSAENNYYIVDVSDRNNVLGDYVKTLETTSPYSNDRSGPDPYDVELTLVTPNDLTADFGYVKAESAIGNYVWSDYDNDGLQDDGETGINGVEVTLVVDYGAGVVMTVTTVTMNDASGNPGFYEFTNLILDEDHLTSPPTFTVSVDTAQSVLSNYQTSPVDQGGSDLEDSDAHSGVVATPEIGNTDTSAQDPETNEQTIASYDFGFAPLGTVGDFIWGDYDAAGDFDAADDVALSGIRVILTASDGTTQTATTNSSGFYSFTVPYDTYTVTVDTSTLPSMWQTTPSADPDGGSNSMSIVTIDNGTPVNLNQDFAYPPKLGVIGDTIWGDNDESAGSSQTAGDTPLSGVVVILTDSSGNTMTTTTNASGMYSFTVPYGAYTVTVDTSTLPGTYETTPNYDPQGPTDSIATVTINDGNPNDLDQDFSYPPRKGVIGDYIWGDNDDSGGATSTAGDTPLGGIEVIATNASGTTFTTTTNASGYYSFTMPYGTYTVTVNTATLPNTYSSTPTYDSNGGDDSTSVATINSGMTSDLTHDFSYPLAKGVIGDTIWGDNDSSAGSGQTAGDTPLAGVVVMLTDSSGNVLTTTTNASGMYSFTVPYGAYTVTVDTSTLPGTYQTTPSYDPQGGADNVATVTISSGAPNNLDQDFSYPPRTGLIGDYIWGDNDESGGSSSTVGDMPIAGVQVILTNASGTTFTTTTNASGYYSFTQPYGTYTVTVNTATLPVTYTSSPTYDPFGAADSVSVVTIDPGSPTNLAQDFSYPPTKGVIGDYLWIDVDNSGGSAPTAGDVQLAGVTLVLTDSSGNTYTTTTNASGFYSFTVPYGSYTVTVVTSTLPNGVSKTPSYDPNGGSDSVSTVTINSGSPTNLAQDFSYPLLGAIGDYVWYDADDDGRQDADEQGIANVLIGLYDITNTLIMTEFTNANGGYLFDQLEPSSYTVRVLDTLNVLDGLRRTTGPQVHDEATAITIPNGGSYIFIDADFGWVRDPGPNAIIGDTIWFDADGDGEQNPGELGIPGVVIVVTDGTNTYTTTTDSLGNYYISVPAGTYTVTVDTSTLPAGLTQTYDLDEDLDNATVVTVASGDQFLDADFGYNEPTILGEIGNQIWIDSVGDGVYDSGSEIGVPGVTVELVHDVNGDGIWQPGEPIVSSVTTDVDGSYLFTGLPADDYLVYVSDNNRVLLEYAPTVSGAPGVDNNNQNQPYAITLPNGGSNMTADFGFVRVGTFGSPLGAIGNQVWVDLDDNGVYSPTAESGIAGVVINLTDSSGNVFTTTTNSEGRYLFINLPASTYTVTVNDIHNVLDGYSLATFGPNPGTDNNHQQQPYVIALGTGELNLTGDFAYIAPRESTAVTLGAFDSGMTTHVAHVLLSTMLLAALSLYIWRRECEA